MFLEMTQGGWINSDTIGSVCSSNFDTESHLMIASAKDGATIGKIYRRAWYQFLAHDSEIIPCPPGYYRIHLPEGTIEDENYFFYRPFYRAPIIGWRNAEDEDAGYKPITIEDFELENMVAVLCPSGEVTTYDDTYSSLDEFERRMKAEWPAQRARQKKWQEIKELREFAKELGIKAA